jgi:acetoin utilization protein AcuB
MLIERIMTQPVVTVELDDRLHEVKNIFERAKFHHLLVVEEGKLYGVLSDRDLLKAISPFIGTVQETAHDKFTLNKKVHQIMSRQPIALTAKDDVYTAINLFNRHLISCIPIIDEQRRPIGIVSWRDILRKIEQNHNRKLKNNE